MLMFVMVSGALGIAMINTLLVKAAARVWSARVSWGKAAVFGFVSLAVSMTVGFVAPDLNWFFNSAVGLVLNMAFGGWFLRRQLSISGQVVGIWGAVRIVATGQAMLLSLALVLTALNLR